MKKILFFLLFLAFFIIPAYSQPNELVVQGISLYTQGKWQESYDAFSKALDADPQNTLVVSYLLDIARKKGDLMATIDAFQRKTMASPEDPVLRAQLGVAYIAQGLYDANRLNDVLEELKQSLSLSPDLSLAYSGMGLVYYVKRMMPRAKGYFLKALEINPNDVVALERLGEILMLDEQKPSESLNLFRKINEILPNYPDGYFYAGSALQKIDQPQDAIEAFKKCMDLDPNGYLEGYWAPIRIADLYLLAGDKTSALEYLQKAQVIAPKSVYIKNKIKELQAPPKTEEKTKTSKEAPKGK